MDIEQKQRTGVANRSPEQERETEQRNITKEKRSREQKHVYRTEAENRSSQSEPRTIEGNGAEEQD
jgi:hypothetical protein